MRIALVRASLRSLLWQGCWSFSRMQEVGLLFSLRPIAAALRDDPAAQARLLREYAGFFNTHPYLSGVVLGVIARAEIEGKEAAQSARDVRAAWMGPLAAIGDAVFWQTLRPLLAFAAVYAAMSGHFLVASAPLVLLVPYNVAHAVTRIWGIAAAARAGVSLVATLAALRPQEQLQRVRILGLSFAAAAGASASVALFPTQASGGAGTVRFEDAPVTAILAALAVFGVGRWTGRTAPVLAAVVFAAALLAAGGERLP